LTVVHRENSNIIPFSGLLLITLNDSFLDIGIDSRPILSLQIGHLIFDILFIFVYSDAHQKHLLHIIKSILALVCTELLWQWDIWFIPEGFIIEYGKYNCA